MNRLRKNLESMITLGSNLAEGDREERSGNLSEKRLHPLQWVLFGGKPVSLGLPSCLQSLPPEDLLPPAGTVSTARSLLSEYGSVSNLHTLDLGEIMFNHPQQ